MNASSIPPSEKNIAEEFEDVDLVFDVNIPAADDDSDPSHAPKDEALSESTISFTNEAVADWSEFPVLSEVVDENGLEDEELTETSIDLDVDQELAALGEEVEEDDEEEEVEEVEEDEDESADFAESNEEPIVFEDSDVSPVMLNEEALGALTPFEDDIVGFERTNGLIGIPQAPEKTVEEPAPRFVEMPPFSSGENLEDTTVTAEPSMLQAAPPDDKTFDVDLPDFPSMSESVDVEEEAPLAGPVTENVKRDDAVLESLATITSAPVKDLVAPMPAIVDRDLAEQWMDKVTETVSQQVFGKLPQMIETALMTMQEDQNQTIIMAVDDALKGITPLLVSMTSESLQKRSAGGIERASLIEATLATMRDELQSDIDHSVRKTLEEFFNEIDRSSKE